MKNLSSLTIILILGILSSCDSTKNDNNSTFNKQPVNKTTFTFEDYTNLIKQIELPLGTDCENALSGLEIQVPDSLISKYRPETSRIFGKLAINDNYVAIIYLYAADQVQPIIQTTDKKGNKVSELGLFDNYCGEDEFSWGTAWFKIENDLTIYLNDSSIIYKRDVNGEIIDSTRKTEVRHRIYVIDENGQILERKEKNVL